MSAFAVWHKNGKYLIVIISATISTTTLAMTTLLMSQKSRVITTVCSQKQTVRHVCSSL